MVKDYFQDIVPPTGGSARTARKVVPSASPAPSYDEFDEEEIEDVVPPVRGIRNIPVPQSRSRGRAPIPDNDPTAGRAFSSPPRFEEQEETPRASRPWLWVLAAVLVIFVGTLGVLATRGTVVTVTPNSHVVTFDQTAQFTAYPAETAATGTLSYTMQTFELEESAVVPAQGTQHVETKASGSITVYNNHSTSPVRLIKDTRFSTPDGLIFRTPADVSIPGKTASGPGKIDITVVADEVGEKYNVGPVAKFTVPGLKGGPMYDNVYASSASAMAGGFSGDQPGVEPGAMSAAVADMRSKIEARARDILATTTSATISFPGLAQIAYQELPVTPEAGNAVRLHHKAVVTVATFPADTFSHLVAQSVSADVVGSRIIIAPGEGYGAAMLTPPGTSTPVFGSGPLPFTLSGKATLVWQVDVPELQKALAGRDEAAFPTIINGFPSIKEAHARIEPFWQSTFPENATDIRVTVKDVVAQ
ncbi:hypothetical protein FJY94_03865 [Candidatus Kaiserbacteria bacterium]|nr:hypothetical protein [Candidatus Kaiserbacteria bacterium]